MEINTSTKQAYAEIDEFLELLDEQTRNEVPKKLRQMFKDEKDQEYHKGINPNIPIKEQNLKSETLALIALLNLQYWCKDETERKRLKQVYRDNEKQYQEKLREKYNPNNIFRNKISSIETDEEQPKQLTRYDNNCIKRLLYKIMKFLRLKK